jgi:hypothetical protein
MPRQGMERFQPTFFFFIFFFLSPSNTSPLKLASLIQADTLLPSNSALQSLGAFELRDGGRWAFLADVAPNAYPQVPQLAAKSDARFDGGPEEFLAQCPAADSAVVQRRLKNKVRKCPGCGKPNAFTLAQCNSCAHSLADVEITFTNNVFTGFVYGLRKGPFPLSVSLRYQDERTLVFDDLLALGPFHVNAIPTDVYAADWRFLLRDPARGLALVNRLHEQCCNILRTQFLGSPAWRAALLSDAAQKLSDDELVRSTMSGFNFPPSQYQLHLQFMMTPLLPFQYLQYLRGLHYTVGRFFPVSYVRAVLSLDVPYDVNDDTPIDDIIAFYKQRGVDYAVIHQDFYAQVDVSQRLIANWKPSQFRALVVDSGAGTPSTVLEYADDARATLRERVGADAKALPANDKTALQNYGRPYDDAGKAVCTYYAFAKSTAADMIEF